MNGTLFGESLWDCGSHVIAVRLDDYPIRQCFHEQVTLQRDEDQGELNLDSTQRPLQGAFLIPPVLPVVLILDRALTLLWRLVVAILPSGLFTLQSKGDGTLDLDKRSDPRP